MKQYITHAIIIVLLFMSLGSCRNVPENIYPLDSAEIYYQPTAPWGLMRFETFGKEKLLDKKGLKFTIKAKDSLDAISYMVCNYHVDSSIREKYEDAVIVALLHHDGIADTLVTNARPEFRINYNSYEVYDSMMVMYLVDAVVSRNEEWKVVYDSLYYDNEFHYLSRSGLSRDDRPRKIRSNVPYFKKAKEFFQELYGVW